MSSWSVLRHRLIKGLSLRESRRRWKGSVRRGMRRFIIEGLESRHLLAQDVLISSTADWASHLTDGKYTIDAGSASVTIGAGVTTSGLDIDITAGEVTIDAGVTIDTGGGSGSAGSFTIMAGKSIDLSDGVAIFAEGPSAADSEDDGDVTLQVKNVLKGFDISGVNQAEAIYRLLTGRKATITIGPMVTITGGTLALETESGNEMVGDFWASQLHLLSKVALEAAHAPDVLSLPVTVQLWEPEATITVGTDATLSGSEQVSVTATATANAIGKAVWNSITKTSGKSPIGFALGDFYNNAVATIAVGSGSSILSDEEIEISTTVDNKIELEVTAIKNSGITKTNPKASSFAWGSTQMKTVSTITLDAGSLVQGEGNVTIEAEATDENSVSSTASAYRDGFMTIGGAFSYTESTVKVVVNGTVISGVTPASDEDQPAVIFNPAFNVDFETDSIHFDTPVSYRTGDALIFDSADGSTIPGLIPGNVYFAIVEPSLPDSLRLAASHEGAISGTAISFGIGYPTLTSGSTDIPIVMVDSVYSNTILFTYDTFPGTSSGSGTGAPLFIDGQSVVYTPIAGQFIGRNDSEGNLIGQLGAGGYTVRIVDSPDASLFPLAIQLIDGQGELVTLNTNSFFTTADGTTFEVAGFDLGTSEVSFNFSSPPTTRDGEEPLPTPPAQTPTQGTTFSNAQPIVFTSGLGNQVGNLSSAQTYWAVVDPSIPGVIRLATSEAQSVAANPAVQDAIPQLKTVSPQAAAVSVVDEFSDSVGTSTIAPQPDGTIRLWNDAQGGTFELTIVGPEGTVTTDGLAYDITTSALGVAISDLAGLVATVTGGGTQSNPWVISIWFQFDIGTVEPGTGLVFTDNPNLADGTPLIYLGNAAKPIGGLVSGNTYYAYNGTNPDFDVDIPQYVLDLRTVADTSAPVVTLELGQSITDATGRVYDFLASIASENLLTLNLLTTAAIDSVDGSTLSAGTVAYQSVPAGAIALSSLADAGTFSLTLTEAGGVSQATGPLPFDASAAAIASALNGLIGTGGGATMVTGSGTLASPWTITGLGDRVLAVDDSALEFDGFETSLFVETLGTNVQKLWSENGEGEFTIDIDTGTALVQTEPIDVDATAAEVARAISALPGMRANVTGTGSVTDPWQISLWYQTIETGDALLFDDSWGFGNLGMINGQTYYAVISENQLTPSGVTLSLAESYADAMAAQPSVIDMEGYLLLAPAQTGLMAGSQMGLDEVTEKTGVTIEATLDASDSASMASGIGLFPMLGFYINSKHNGVENGTWISGIEKEIEEKLPENETVFGPLFNEYFGIEQHVDITSPFEVSLGFALLISNNDVGVTIGPTAVIESAGAVTIGSSIDHVLHSFASAGVARTTGTEEETLGNKAVGVALALSFIDNSSLSLIESNARVSGATGISVDSEITYPFAWKETTIAAIYNDDFAKEDSKTKAADGTKLAENVLTTALFSSAFGVSKWLFNDSVNVSAVPGDGASNALKFAISGGMVYKQVTNSSIAQIEDGAQINQGSTDGDRGLDLSATTSVDQVTMAGEMVLGLNLGWLYYAQKAGGLSQNHSWIIGLTDAKDTVGGSLNQTVFDNNTQALIGGSSTAVTPSGPTNVNFGTGGLRLEANTDMTFVPLAQSGGVASGLGVAASIAVFEGQTQTTQAAILVAAAAPNVIADSGSQGKIELSALDDSVITPSTGGLLFGQSVDLGISASVMTIDRDVAAFIGAAGFHETPMNQVVIVAAGEIGISATATGKFVPVALAGSTMDKGAKKEGEKSKLPDGEEVHWGFGVSGDYSEVNVTDSVQASINGVAVTGNPSSLDLVAMNDTQADLATGAASIQHDKGRNSGGGIAGAASYASYSSAVEAGISGADIEAGDISIEATNTKSIGSFAVGLNGSSVAATAIEVAGSFALNRVTNVTTAQIVGSSGTGLGTIDIAASEVDDVVAAAGTLTALTSLGSRSEGEDEGKSKTKIGFGLGYAQNLIDSTTHAVVSSSQLQQSAGDVSVESGQSTRSFVLSAGVVFEVGKGAGIAPYGMVALNQVTSADVQAAVEQGSTISSSSTDATAGMRVASELVPIMITVAGDLGLGIAYKTGAGATETSLGAGVSVTKAEITGNSLATVSDSSVLITQGGLSVDAFTGQASDSSALDSVLNEINLPEGNYNLFSLAIAGGVATSSAVSGEMALGIDGVGAGIGSSTTITTQATVTEGSTIAVDTLVVTAEEDLNIYNDAGGASVSIALSDDPAVGIAVGVGATVHQSHNGVAASVTDSVVTTTEDLTIDAASDSSVTTIGFGVALDVAVASTAVGFGSSSAIAKIVSDNTITASISGGTTTVGDESVAALSVTAKDDSAFYTGVGSGSLSVSGGGVGVALAAGDSVSRIDPSHSVSAFIGSDTSGSTGSTTVTASGPITVEATNGQQLTAQSIAVASSVAIGGVAVGVAAAGASSRITTGNAITAGILPGALVSSTLAEPDGNAVTVSATDEMTILSTVGSGALEVSLSEVPVGASLGISISEITNNDNVRAQIRGASVATSGGDVVVKTYGSNAHRGKSVATSASVSIGAAGAGANSNIYDNATFAAEINDGAGLEATVVTGDATSGYGSLTVQSITTESILAEVFGGSAGLGSIGVFLSDAYRSGSTSAGIETGGDVVVGDLTLQAYADHTVTSDGMSVTVGGLAGSGEAHKLWINEEVTVSVDGSGNDWNIFGGLTVGAKGRNDATAKTSGAGDDQQSVSIGLLGAGGFVVRSFVEPTVTVSVSNVGLNVTGAAAFGAVAELANQATARSGSGSLVGADAAVAETENSPTIALTTSGLELMSDGVTFKTLNATTYSTNTNSVYATLLGGSAAKATNNSAPDQALVLGAGTTIKSYGSVIIDSTSSIVGVGAGSSNNASGFMANVGGGGLAGGFGAVTKSTMTSDSSIELSDNVSIEAGASGNILIGAQGNWNTNQLTHMATGSGISGVGISSTLDSDQSLTIRVGDQVTLSAPKGQIGIGTNLRGVTSADSYSYTFGLAGSVTGVAKNQGTTLQSVTIGEDAVISAAAGINITAGYNPLTKIGTQTDTFAIVTSRATGLLVIPDNVYDASLDVTTNVDIASGAQIISDRDVQVGAVPGINSAVAHSFANTDGAKGRTHTVSDDVTESGTVTIDGTIVAGNSHELDIRIEASGDGFTVNGGATQTFSGPGDGTLVSVEPQAGEAFFPFQVGYDQAYDPAELLVGLDPTVQLVLSLSLSSTPVTAITLQGLAAAGGRVLIEAGTLSGSGTVSAYSPEITVDNPSPVYLMLGSVNVPETYGMGQVNLSGDATKPTSMTFNTAANAPTVSIASTAAGPVGNNAAGPAIGLTGNVNNTGGSVFITNSEGAFAQAGSINADSVVIDVPNASYIVNTPDDYFGAAGDVQDYWGNSSNLIPDGNFESPQWASQSGSFDYNVTQLGWTFSSQSGVSGNGSGFTSGNPNAPIGSQVAFVQTTGTISRELTGLIPGSTYELQFYAAQRENDGSQTQQLAITLGGQSLGTVIPSGTSYQLQSIPFVAPLPQTTPVSNTNQLTLTDGGNDTATAAWNPNLVSIPTSGSITFEFTYQAGGNKAADGIALVFQNQGTFALGQTGGALGYVGILGNTAAYQINLYNGHAQGSNFVTTNSSGTYLTTGSVNFDSGDAIRVTLVYDADANTVTESLTDLTTNATFSRTYSDIDLADLVGNVAYIGFTGGDGAATSTQTVSDFSMTTPATTGLNGFAGWGYVTPLSLTFTGLDPGGSDETVFIDGVTLSQNPNGFTPGMNWYSPFLSSGPYSANVAASSAANAIYANSSGANNSIGFSDWLYNTGGNQINTNSNVSVGNIGSNYPSKAGDNYGSYQHGSGVIFFGSEIPYLWAGGPTDVTAGTGFLTDSDLGYLDTLSNAQGYSTAASGNPNDSGLNVTQGTGPPERGIFPVVPLNTNGTFPTSASVTTPQTRSLGGSITAGNIAVTARYIDINGPINVGVTNQAISLILGASLQSMIDQYQQSYDAGGGTNPEISIDGYLGDSGLTGYYDAQSKQIILSPYAINAGKVAATFNGGIISTTGSGKIRMTSDPNAVSIVNQTNVPLVLEGITATGTVPTGIVEFQDTLSNSATIYVYEAGGDGVRVYQGDYGATLSEMTLSQTSAGDTISHALDTSLTYQWSRQVDISRQLSFTNSGSGIALLGSSVINDSWSWGSLNSNGTAPNDYGTAYDPFGSTTATVVTQASSGYSQTLTASIQEQASATTTFVSSYKDAWNYGPSTEWTWTFPTEIQLLLQSQLPAGNPIAIDFARVSTGSLNVQSTASSLYINGNVRFPGSVALSGQTGLFQAAQAVIEAQSVQLQSASGGIGSEAVPIAIQLTPSTPIEATASTGIHLSSLADMLIGEVHAMAGPVSLRSAGDILGAGNASAPAVTGTNVTLSATVGDIGTQVAPLFIQTQTQTLSTGTVVDGLLSAIAEGSIYLAQPRGDLRVASVVTTSSVGVVSITNLAGDITDGLFKDAYGLSGTGLSPGGVEHLLRAVAVRADDSAEMTIDGFDASVNASYLRYWNVVDQSTLQDGTYTLTQDGVNFYQSQANAFYRLPAVSGFDDWVSNRDLPRSQTTLTLSNGDVASSGFGDWVSVGGAQVSASGELTLTDGSGNEAKAMWYPQTLAVPTTGTLELSFTYTAGGDREADGIALAFQTVGTSALGGAGGSLGYAGITGPTAAYQINLFNGHVQGSNFVVTNTAGTYLATGGVSFVSGHPIDIKLVYDADAQTLTETLTDTVTGASFTRSYSDIDLAGVLGSNAYLGFTGGCGGETSIQSVTDFSMTLRGATAVWGPDALAIPTSGGFQIGFSYQLNGEGANNGITLAFQTEGVNASGQAGAGLGYVGIAGPTAAYQISINGQGGSVVGSNFVLTNSAGSYLTTGNVNFASGHRISVLLVYDARAETLTETLLDTQTGASFSRVYPGIDLSAVLGPNVFIGFTGSDGQGQTTQTVSGFSLVENASVEQVQGYATGLYDNAVGLFEEDLVFGAGWESLPQFEAFDQAYTFTASDEAVAELSYGAVSVANAFALLSLDALSPKGQKQLGENVAPSISTAVLNLSAGGSIGRFEAPVEISIDNVRSGNLTPREKTLLSQATTAGELQFVGVDASGATIIYSYGNEPAGVTPTGVVVKIEQPLMIDVSAGGLTMLSASGPINVTQTNGAMGLLYAKGGTSGLDGGTTPVVLEAQGSILQATLHASTDSAGWSLNADGTLGFASSDGVWSPSSLTFGGTPAAGITSRALSLTAGESIGSAEDSLAFTASGEVELFALGSAWLFTDAALRVREWTVKGALNLDVEGGAATTDVLADSRGSFVGFAAGGNGWGSTTLNGTVDVSTTTVGVDLLTLTTERVPLGVVSTANYSQVVFTKEAPVKLGAKFVFGFSYQSNGSGARAALNLGNTGQPGLALVLNQGDGGSASGWADLVSTSEFGTASSGESLGDVVLNSGHPIQVVWSFDDLTQSATVTFTDTVTLATSSFTKSGIKLVQLLGSQSAKLSWQGIGDGSAEVTQSINGFQFVDGPSNMTAGSLNVTSGGSLGTLLFPGFGNWVAAGGAIVTETESLTLTDGGENASAAYWYPEPLTIPASGQLELTFTYVASGNRQADGITLAMQTQGIDAVGAVGGSLGYVGITGKTVAYQINLYDGHGQGSNFVTSNVSGNYLATGAVQFSSGHPIEVVLVYDADAQTITESLTDTVTGAKFTRTYTDVDLAAALGENAYFGFTGGSGGDTAIQTVTGFTISGRNSLEFAEPVLILIDGEVSINAGGNVVATQILGDLEVGTVVSPATVSVSAPFGAVVNYQPPSVAGADASGEAPLSGVIATTVEVNAGLGIGDSSGPLNIAAGQLFASTLWNDAALYNAAFGERVRTTVEGLIAGGDLRLVSDITLGVAGKVIGNSASFETFQVGQSIDIVIAGLSSLQRDALPVSLGGFEDLRIDDFLAEIARNFQVAKGLVDAGSVKIRLGDIKSLAFDLGSAADVIAVKDTSGLLSLRANLGGGDDRFDIAKEGIAIGQFDLTGDSGADVLTIDARGIGIWLTDGKVELAGGTINHVTVDRLILDNLEQEGLAGAISRIEVDPTNYPARRLTLIGTTGADSIAMSSQATELRFKTSWNGTTGERRTFPTTRIDELMLITLGGDDFISILGQTPIGISIDSGRGDDWVNVREVSANITDLHGDNTILTGGGDDSIHTGSGDDEVDAQGGRNKIVDDGGTNRILTGDQDDEIRHENPDDWIVAAAGVNHIWLSGIHQGWQNPKLAADVNRDGLITALDALIVLNRLSAKGSQILVGSPDSVSHYYDANGDGLLAPIDALYVLNRMPGRRPVASGERESDMSRSQIASQDSDAVAMADSKDATGPGGRGFDLTFVAGRRAGSTRLIDDFFSGYDGSIGLYDPLEELELRPGRRGQARRSK